MTWEALGKGLEAELKGMGESERWEGKRKLQGKKKQDQERGDIRGCYRKCIERVQQGGHPEPPHRLCQQEAGTKHGERRGQVSSKGRDTVATLPSVW